MIEHIVEYYPVYGAICLATISVPALIRRVVKWNRTSDDRAVMARLCSRGPQRAEDMSSLLCSVPLDLSLTRLHAKGLVEKSGDDVPVFKLSEGAEVLIED